MLYRDEIYHSLCCYVKDMEAGQRANHRDLEDFFNNHEETPHVIEFTALAPLLPLTRESKETGVEEKVTSTVVVAALKHPACPSFLLEAACLSGNIQYRAAAVQHVNCPVEYQVEAWLGPNPMLKFALQS